MSIGSISLFDGMVEFYEPGGEIAASTVQGGYSGIGDLRAQL
jgi:hypothetical protein